MSTDITQLKNLLALYDKQVVAAVLESLDENTTIAEPIETDVATIETSDQNELTPVYDAPVIASPMREGAWLQKQLADVADPGTPLTIDQDANICTIESMGIIERIVGEANFLPAHFLEEGAMILRAVGRVALKVPHAGLPAGNGWGTGFLVAPSILMTNNHVIESAALAAKFEVQFNYQLDEQGMPQSVDTYQFNAADFFYTNAALDFTLIRIRPKCRFTHFTQHEARPFLPFQCRNAGQRWGHLQLTSSVTYSADGDQYINIVQHPRGRRKEVALHDNLVTQVFDNHIRYTTDTEPGSSGSPVFNNSWNLLAIHHAAGARNGGVWVSNQGVRMDRIITHIRNNVDADIVAELGL
ncbi:MAG: trypsin-like serine peptidase [Candidatus Promineifilaceae bacterium]